MIKIIEPGNIFKIKCPECNCLFQFEKEDIEIRRIGRDELPTVKCPQCEKIITGGSVRKDWPL